MNHNKLQKSLQKKISSIIFPTRPNRDWYSHKDYKNFEYFKEKNFSNEAAMLYSNKNWNKLEPEREFVDSKDVRGNYTKIDFVSLKQKEPDDKKIGYGLHIVNFLGSGQNYETYYEDLVKQANETGAHTHVFNFPGMYSSEGEVREFNDLVNSGISVINHMLCNGIHPDKIVIQGNCMGAAVAQEVAKRFEDQGIKLRTINSNSFKSIKSLIVNKYFLQPFEGAIKNLLKFTGWEIKPGMSLKENAISPYHLVLSRNNDKTISKNISMMNKVEKYSIDQEISAGREDYKNSYEKDIKPHIKMNLKSDYDTPEEKKAYKKLATTDPHSESISNLVSSTDKNTSFFDVLNKYLKISNDFISQNPQQIEKDKYIQGIPLITTSANIMVKDKIEILSMKSTISTIEKAYTASKSKDTEWMRGNIPTKPRAIKPSGISYN